MSNQARRAEVEPIRTDEVEGALKNGRYLKSDATAASRVLVAELYRPESSQPGFAPRTPEQLAESRINKLMTANNKLTEKGILPAIELAYLQDTKAPDQKNLVKFGGVNQDSPTVDNFARFAKASGGINSISKSDLMAVVDDRSGMYSAVDKAIAENVAKSSLFSGEKEGASYTKDQMTQAVTDLKDKSKYDQNRANDGLESRRVEDVYPSNVKEISERRFLEDTTSETPG